ncbi:MAG: hypothetical protein DVB28_000927 [Verrucomicrobia bacterium]|nr:MAG: hypothetical protein DVB28_000927 [Verrucomicrobiota bacterium]
MVLDDVRARILRPKVRCLFSCCEMEEESFTFEEWSAEMAFL